MLHEVASNVTDLASRHIWSSSRTCRRYLPGLWPSCREGVALQTTETCSPAPFENTSDTTISVYSPLAFRILPLSYHRSLPDTVMALCCRLHSPASPLSVVSIRYENIYWNDEIGVMVFLISEVRLHLLCGWTEFGSPASHADKICKYINT